MEEFEEEVFELKDFIIGLTGKARAGKDTFGRMLATELFRLDRIRFVLIAYANELKRRCQNDFDLSYDQLWGDNKEVPDSRYPKRGSDSSFLSAREILQAYGEFFRTIDNNFWVNRLFDTIKSKKYKSVIITDIRHPNEADPVREVGGIIIRINRPNNELKIHGTNHISETAMDDYVPDFFVDNSGTLDDLKKMARDMAILINEKRRNKNGK